LGAVVYDAGDAVAASFREGKNPFGPWKFGWSVGLNGELHTFTSNEQSKQDNGQESVWFDPINYYDITPTVRHNFGPDYNNNDVSFKAGALLLTPRGNVQPSYCHVLWSAPEDGTYAVSCAFFGQQRNINVDVHVLVNGRSVLDSVLAKTGDSRAFAGNFVLKTGDTIDFAVGPQGGPRAYAFATGLDAKIAKQ
jgi:hypothetical protein